MTAPSHLAAIETSKHRLSRDFWRRRFSTFATVSTRSGHTQAATLISILVDSVPELFVSGRRSGHNFRVARTPGAIRKADQDR